MGPGHGVGVHYEDSEERSESSSLKCWDPEGESIVNIEGKEMHERPHGETSESRPNARSGTEMADRGAKSGCDGLLFLDQEDFGVLEMKSAFFVVGEQRRVWIVEVFCLNIDGLSGRLDHGQGRNNVAIGVTNLTSMELALVSSDGPKFATLLTAKSITTMVATVA